MPYTAKQRRYFHAQAAKGKPGMEKLASEADAYAKAGKEKKPVAKPTMKGVIKAATAGGMPKTPQRTPTAKKAAGPATGSAIRATAKKVAAAKKAATPVKKTRGSY